MKIFLNTQFTGLHKDTTLVSIGMIAEDGRELYRELNDYDKTQIDTYIQANVIKSCFGVNQINTRQLRKQIREFIKPYDSVEIWGDVLAYDWVLFCNIFGGAEHLPKKIYDIPFDFSTMLKMQRIDPDIDRNYLSNYFQDFSVLNNALEKAIILKKCYERVIQEETSRQKEYIHLLCGAQTNDKEEEEDTKRAALREKDKLKKEHIECVTKDTNCPTIQHQPRLDMDTLRDFLTKDKIPTLDYFVCGVDHKKYMMEQWRETLKQLTSYYQTLSISNMYLPEISEEEGALLRSKIDIPKDYPNIVLNEQHAKDESCQAMNELISKTLDAHKEGLLIYDAASKTTCTPFAVLQALVLDTSIINIEDFSAVSKEDLESLELEELLVRHMRSSLICYQISTEATLNAMLFYTTSSNTEYQIETIIQEYNNQIYGEINTLCRTYIDNKLTVVENITSQEELQKLIDKYKVM